MVIRLIKADWSYYTSIFDAVDLYSSKTELFFYYYDYSGFNLNDLFLRLNKLIRNYGSTLGRDHGDSLLHKLILENRIHIEGLKEYKIIQPVANSPKLQKSDLNFPTKFERLLAEQIQINQSESKT
ncbi:hypothetical protein AO468_06405 [Oenococcus oeni]|uniref:hypothetical protein n=1 Tax=Oenococcus oeni TaxID=1247 RepID=UPI0008F95D2D|nr:hypothetical protein [Oenococcus oeni]OIK96827.1 hypothetical protein ATW86_10130 [Oenococcus oeni]PDH93250.1 hypothetical protein AO468_06405 [Oenococcus oeni]